MTNIIGIVTFVKSRPGKKVGGENAKRNMIQYDWLTWSFRTVGPIGLHSGAHCAAGLTLTQFKSASAQVLRLIIQTWPEKSVGGDYLLRYINNPEMELRIYCTIPTDELW